MPAHRGGLNPVLPEWRGKYQCPYFLLLFTTLDLSYYGELHLRGDPDDIWWVVTFAIFEFAVQAGVQFLLYAVTGAVRDYSVGLLRFVHVWGGAKH